MVKCKKCKWLATSITGKKYCLSSEDKSEEGEDIIINFPCEILEEDGECFGFIKEPLFRLRWKRKK